jgi:hypothetical protein
MTIATRCPDHPVREDDAFCRVCHARRCVEELARVSQALATEWGILEAEVRQEIQRRSQANMLRETPLVSQWLTLFSAVAEDGNFKD